MMKDPSLTYTSEVKANTSSSVWWEISYTTFLEDNLAKCHNLKCINPLTLSRYLNLESGKINEIGMVGNEEGSHLKMSTIVCRWLMV